MKETLLTIQICDNYCQDHDFYRKVIKILVKNFGSDDLDWLSASETLLNSIFHLKLNESHVMAKEFLNGLSQVPINDYLKKAQIFFVVGHISIKVLVYIDHIETEIEGFLKQS